MHIHINMTTKLLCVWGGVILFKTKQKTPTPQFHEHMPIYKCITQKPKGFIYLFIPSLYSTYIYTCCV